MKILHLASWYPNKIGEQEGDFIQRHLQAIALRMPVHVIHVVKDVSLTTRTSRIKTQSGNLTETIIYYKPLKTGSPAVDKLISLRTYLKVLRQEISLHIKEQGRPDLVHLHVAMRAGIAALWMKRSFGIPYIISEHWSGYFQIDPDNYFVRDRLFRNYTKNIIRNASSITAVSQDLARRISALFGVENTSVIYNVVNTDRFCYVASANHEFTFIHISNMHPIKNIEGMFRALGRLKNLRSEWKLIIVGSDDIHYRHLAVRMGINDQVEWTGSVAHDQVPQLIRQSNALLMFSNHENLSCVVCESLCCGIPVVATAVGGLPEIINDTNGLLCGAGDEEGLLLRISDIMDNYGRFDKPQIASNAAEIFNEKLIGEAFQSVYEQVLYKS